MKVEEFEALGIQRLDLVLVEWVDIFEEDDLAEDAVMSPMRCTSLGWYDGYIKSHLVIIKEKRGNKVDKQVFPIGCVTNVRKILVMPP